MMAGPPDFVDLDTAYNSPAGTFVNVIGVVVDLMQPKITAKGQYMLTFKLQDRSLYASMYGGQGLSVRFFKTDAHNLPEVRNIGDVVLLRSLKSQPYAQQPMLISNMSTVVLIFPAAAIPDPNFEISFQGNHRLECRGAPIHKQSLTLAEQKYVIDLYQEMKFILPADDFRSGLPSQTRSEDRTSHRVELTQATGSSHTSTHQPRQEYNGSTDLSSGSKGASEQSEAKKRHSEAVSLTASKKIRTSAFGKKFRLIEEVRHYEFADLCGQVVKTFSYGSGCDLYITDYTENRDMFYYAPPEEESNHHRDGDEFGYSDGKKREWPGPYGHLVLKVNVKDPHASFINRMVNTGDFVLLKNVKMKIMAEGRKLEGDMWPDDYNLDRVNVVKLASHGPLEVDAVLERKEKYWESRSTSAAKAAAPPKLTKTEKKKRKKLEREALAAGAKAHAAPSTSTASAALPKKRATNPYIRCNHEEIPVISIRDIRDPQNIHHTTTTPAGNSYNLPFVNAKHRARVRCVDFEPKNLASFAVLNAQLEHESADFDDAGVESIPNSHGYGWNFSLLLEDVEKPDAEGDDSIWVNLGHADAQYLFGNTLPDPQDLSQDTPLLTQLRERLCILWGNLEETKSAGEGVLSNLPFECCISEFGVRTDEVDDVVVVDEGNVSKATNGSNRLEIRGWKRCYRMFGVTIL